MEQPIDQPLAGQLRVDQLDVLDRGDQRAAFHPGVVFRQRVRRGALRRIARIEIGDAGAFRRLRQELQQDAAGAPAVAGAALAGAQFLGHRQPHPRRDLLGAMEIFMRGVFQRAAFERDEALVTVHVSALVDGHGEMAFAEQRPGIGLARRNRRRDAIFVEARAGAHLAGRGEVHHQHAHRAVVLGLQYEAAVDLQGRAQHDCEHHGLAQELGNRLRIGMSAENPVHHRPEPHHAAAQVKRSHFKRHHGVVGRRGRRRAGGNGDFGIAHRRYVERSVQIATGRPRAGTRPAGPSGRAADFRPRRTPPIAGRPSPRR